MVTNQFSILLKRYIQDSNLSISSIAKNSNIERSQIQNYISGKRLPATYQDIDNLINQLALTKIQIIELKNFYKLEKIGYNKFYKLNLLKSLIEDINKKYSIKPVLKIQYIFERIQNFATNIEELKLLLNYILEKNLPLQKMQILMNTDKHLFPIIIQYILQHPNLQIEIILHMQTLSYNNETSYNLIQLNDLLPLLTTLKNLKIRYVYINNPGDYTLFPFFIITNKHCLEINSDCTSGILLNTNNYLINEFNHKFNQANPFVEISNSCFNYQLNLFQFYNSKTFYSSSLYLLPWLDIDLLMKHYLGPQEQKEIIKQYFQQYLEQIKKYALDNTITLYCCNSLVVNKQLLGLSSALFSPFSKAELHIILKKMLQTLKDNKHYQFRLIDNNLFKLPENLLIYYLSSHTIISFQDKTLHLLEETINHDFHFLEQVINELEECSLDRDKSLTLLETLID